VAKHVRKLVKHSIFAHLSLHAGLAHICTVRIRTFTCALALLLTCSPLARSLYLSHSLPLSFLLSWRGTPPPTPLPVYSTDSADASASAYVDVFWRRWFVMIFSWRFSCFSTRSAIGRNFFLLIFSTNFNRLFYSLRCCAGQVRDKEPISD